jgi:hypothetical protein
MILSDDFRLTYGRVHAQLRSDSDKAKVKANASADVRTGTQSRTIVRLEWKVKG